MNNKIILAMMLMVAAAIGSPKVFATPAARVMAEILSHMAHAPADAETTQLHRVLEPPAVLRGQGKAQVARAIIFASSQHSPPHGSALRRFFIDAESPARRPNAHCPGG